MADDPGRRRLGVTVIGVVVGTVVGAVVGAIAAVNFVIFVGIERGYEASIGDVFRQSAAAGVVTVAILVAGPLVGAWVGVRSRRRRSHVAHR